MIEIRRILCPIDFSNFSRRAFDHAVAIARWYESTITLLHVRAVVPVAAYAPESGVLPSPALAPDERAAIVDEMSRFVSTGEGTTVPLDFEVAEGAAAAAILAKAEGLPADLLVLGTHGRSGFERLVLGSVTEKVLRKAACPVLTVPRTLQEETPAPSVLFRRIVCAIDFSDCSMHALEYAMSLAQEADAHLTVMHVIEVPPEIPREVHETPITAPRSLADFITVAMDDRRTRLNDAIPESVRTYSTVETVMATGTAYREILRVAEEQQAELLVVGVRGRGVVDRFLFGSTAQHLVREASCPVLTLRKG